MSLKFKINRVGAWLALLILILLPIGADACISNAECGPDYYCDFKYGAYGDCQCRWGVLEVGLPNSGTAGVSVCEFINNLGGGTTALGRYINLIVVAIIALVIMSAMVTIVIGGYLYMTAMGNADRVRQAKVWIGSALLGIFLALAAYTILNFINPTLVQF